MSSEVLTFTCGPGQTAVGGRGRIWNLLSAPGGAVTINCDTRSVQGGQSPQRIFKNVPPGTKFTAAVGEHWTYLRIDSAVLQTITIFIGEEDLQFNNAVTVTGTAVTTVAPSNTVTDTADTVQAAGSSTNFPQNLARRRVTIGNRETSVGIIRVSGQGTTGHGVVLQPGTFAEFDTTASLNIRADGASAATWYAIEET